MIFFMGLGFFMNVLVILPELCAHGSWRLDGDS